MRASERAQFLLDVTTEAGTLAHRLQQGISYRHKPDGSLVTDADLAVDGFLKDRLTAAFPDYGWLSEETPDTKDRLDKRLCWIVDPIDGTRSFAHGGNNWCVGAALVDGGVPIEACLLHPNLEQVFVARSGSGCFRNDERLSIHDGKLTGARVMGSTRLVNALTAHGAVHVAAGDVPLLARLALLASGKLDAVVSVGPKHDWDIAAGALLVTEAGGLATGLHGEPFQFNGPKHQQSGLVAAAPSRHKAIMKILELA